MLPSLVAHELEEAVTRYLRASFPMTTPGFRRADGRTMVDDFLDAPGALFKGPYLGLGLPFLHAEGEAVTPFHHLELPFAPYRHQLRAYERLCSDSPRSTLVATGTGSGKTECFLYPLLEHCAANRERGVKAIVIYPMNALAIDQARRIAGLVAGQPGLNGRVSVGLFVGESEAQPSKRMTADSVITCKETLRSQPPDILLTNYKMLDFLLMRPQDQSLWQFNEPGRLRYLVVDELHTFDGAQGTDLACLVRRLRDRLVGHASLACVGTSATIGGAEAAETLRDYAGQIFTTPFDSDSVILEERETPAQFLRGVELAHTLWPTDAAQRDALRPERHASANGYLHAQALLWLGQEAPALDADDPQESTRARIELGERLRGLAAFRELLERASGLLEVRYLLEAWQSRHAIDAEHARLLFDSLLALVSTARSGSVEHPRPLLTVRLQLWLRELRRMVASVAEVPQLLYSDDQGHEEQRLELPVAHCRNCHAAGWVSVRREEEGRLEQELPAIYQAWFSNHPEVCLLYPLQGPPPSEPKGFDAVVNVVHASLRSYRGEPPELLRGGEEPALRVWQPDQRREVERGEQRRVITHHDCPWCGAQEGLSLIGAQAASLASVMIGQLYGSAYNDHHKLIAFSDSVQDAAHRAGFFGARTYTTLVRRAVARFIQDQGAGLDLATVAQELPRYWQRKMGSDAAFVGTFIAPNMEWLRDYQRLCNEGQVAPGSDLTALVAQRLEWEVIQGFGLRARIGRTLERSRLAAVAVERDALLQSAERLARALGEEVGELRGIDAAAVVRFLLGVLWRMRTRGGFYHPALDAYIAQAGDTFMPFHRSRFMPSYGKTSPPPALLTLGRVSRSFDALHREGGSWYRLWFLRVVASEERVLASDAFGQVMTLLVRQLRQDGLLVERTVRGESVYGLDPARWHCSSRVAVAVCDQCGHRLEVADEEGDLWHGLDCLRAGCAGHYATEPARPVVDSELARGQPTRLVPAEHTALLDAEQRKQIELAFIHGDRPWEVNLLSATPTLEMGIDIGDLSSVLLCSVPPTQSSYLQRIGRAGRRDGNALAVTVANGHNHDLYFYQDPLQMIAGQIRPPGVFLQATAVLERQLAAFCFDRWAASGIEPNAVPKPLREVLNAVEATDQNRFPYTFLAFVEGKRNALYRDFLLLFPELPESALDHLRTFLFGEEQERGMVYRIIDRLSYVVRQRQQWSKRIDRLKAEYKALESQPQDEAIRERLEGLAAERHALSALRSNTNRRAALNFFTDEGLLPNYAFPEEGVTLQSIILRRRSEQEREEEEGGSRYERINFTVQRPAQSALSELAPLSHFYAVGREVEIDQIDLGLSQVEEWRLCDQCHFVDNVTQHGERYSVCPRCGSAQWADSGQKRTLLKLRQVYATAEDRRSRIGDDSDQRTPLFFNRQMLVDVPPGQSTRAYRLPDEALPFAFEYLPRVTLREINFGQLGLNTAQSLVAGQLAARPGFQICRHCGKVRRSGGRRRSGFEHAYDCKLRRPGVVEQESDYFESLYLFRELESEAVRILLPLAEVAVSEVHLNSLIAALQLGLRRYFRGSVDHLRVAHYSAPSASGTRKQYLVLYDSVPGGTGYLKELLSAPRQLIEVLQAAHQVVSRCGCREEPNKDGCYHCLLAYRESRNKELISRQVAEDLLARILAQAETLETIESIEEIDINPLIESELEQRFLSVLTNHGAGVTVTPEMVNGKPGLFLSIGGETLARYAGGDAAPVAWKIEPQVVLGPAQGVARICRPDFVLWPVREEEGVLPVAIFTDGFAHHYDKVDDDTAKRQAILDSGRFYVWSLAWHDLPGQGSRNNHPSLALLDHAQRSLGQQLFSLLAPHAGWENPAAYQPQLREGPYRWLIAYLAGTAAAARHLREAALSRLLGWLDERSASDPARGGALAQELRGWTPAHIHAQLTEAGPTILGGLNEALESARGGVRVVVGLPTEAMQRAAQGALEAFSELRVHLALEDEQAALNEAYETSWQAFWGLANLLQFHPRFTLASQRGVAQELYPEPPQTLQPAANEWAQLMAFSAFGEALVPLQQLGVELPVLGYELMVDQAIVAEAELAWPGRRIAVLYDADSEAQTRFEADGWQLFVGLDERLVAALTAREKES